MYGGITLSVSGEDGTVMLRRFRVPEAWIPVLFIAGRESRTSEMRAALPAEVPHRGGGATGGPQRPAGHRGSDLRRGLLAEAMDDRLHQPYRLPRLPGAAELIEVAYERGAAGACLSGAGPSVLAICDSPISAHAVEKAWNAAGMPGMATRLRFDTYGARLTSAAAPAEEL